MPYNKKVLFPMVGLGLLLTLTLQGCANFGPGNLQAGRSEYNQAIQHSNDEQMLLNLVRLRYRDAPMFLGVGSVSSQMNYTAGVGGSGSFQPNAKPSGGLSFSLGYAEKPTVSYSPLQGEAFMQQLLAPIPLDRLALLYHSGWSAKRIFRLCVQRMNNVRNAPRASGPTPGTEPVFKSFQVLTNLLRKMQVQDEVDLIFDKHNGVALPSIVRKSDGTKDNKIWKDFLRALGIKETPDQLFLTEDARMKDHTFLRIKTRSFMGVLFFLSQSVIPHAEDEEAGLVTVTKDARGQRFDWSRVVGGLMRIDHSDHPPGAKAATSVYYRGRWYFVRDNDLDSKSTFSLLHQLFSLQAGKMDVQSPLLMLPMGG